MATLWLPRERLKRKSFLRNKVEQKDCSGKRDPSAGRQVRLRRGARPKN